MDNLLFIRKSIFPLDISAICESTPGNQIEAKAFTKLKYGGDNIKPQCEVFSISTSEKKIAIRSVSW